MYKKMYKRIVSVVLTGVMIVVSITGCGQKTENKSNTNTAPDAASATDGSDAPAQETGRSRVWKVSAMGSETHPTTQGWYIFEEEVEKRLPDVDVQVFINGQLGTSADQCIGGMQNGIIQFSDISVGNVAEYSTAFMPLDTPFLFEDRDTALQVVDGEAGTAMADKYLADTDIKLLGYWDYGFRNVTNSKKPIQSISDFSGLKIRTLNNNIYLDMLTCLGANPNTMAYAEVFTGLQQGTIDGQENPNSSIVDAKFYEVQKYLTLTEHIYGFLGLHMGGAFYDSLTDEEKKAVEESADAAIEKQREICNKANDDALTVCEDASIEVITLTDEQKGEMRDATRPVWDTIAEKCGEDLFRQVVEAAGQEY